MGDQRHGSIYEGHMCMYMDHAHLVDRRHGSIYEGHMCMYMDHAHLVDRRHGSIYEGCMCMYMDHAHLVQGGEPNEHCNAMGACGAGSHRLVSLNSHSEGCGERGFR